MSDPFLGQLMLVGFNFAQTNFQLAQGQLLPISRYAALFSLLGTYYGGDGKSTFALPNLQGSVPVGQGQGPGLSNYDIGEVGGVPNVTLLATESPNHNHNAYGITGTGQSNPANNAFGDSTVGPIYANSTALTKMAPAALPPFPGGSQPHNNMMPYLVLNWVIAMVGVFPARN